MNIDQLRPADRAKPGTPGLGAPKGEAPSFLRALRRESPSDGGNPRSARTAYLTFRNRRPSKTGEATKPRSVGDLFARQASGRSTMRDSKRPTLYSALRANGNGGYEAACLRCGTAGSPAVSLRTSWLRAFANYRLRAVATSLQASPDADHIILRWSRFFGQVVKVDSRTEQEAPRWPGRDGGSRRSSRHG